MHGKGRYVNQDGEMWGGEFNEGQATGLVLELS